MYLGPSFCHAAEQATPANLHRVPGTGQGLPWKLTSKESSGNAGEGDSIPGSGRSPGQGNGNPVQYSCLENPMDGGAWRATVHGVAKSQTRLSNFTFTFFEVKTEKLVKQK